IIPDRQGAAGPRGRLRPRLGSGPHRRCVRQNAGGELPRPSRTAEMPELSRPIVLPGDRSEDAGGELMRFTAEQLARLTAADPASGKTTVISQRVVWLVANGHVSPEEILGLTFTRKAVGELGGRIRVLLSRLRHNLGQGRELSLPGLDTPTVSTYNSYAASIVSEHGPSLGIEPQ